jgi:peptidoglycan/LPS O-acetylase OafA/YrhL
MIIMKSDNITAPKRSIDSFESLRLLFIIFLFIDHYFNKDFFEICSAGGLITVSYFMTLSGFVLSMHYTDKIKRHEFEYKHFIQKRLIRLFPLHLVCLLLFIIAFHDFSPATMLKTIPSFFLIQSWIPVMDIFYGGNGVAWFLSDMLFFYLIFPLVVKFTARFSTRVLLVFSVILMMMITFLAKLSNINFEIFYTSPLFRLIDFYLGILMFKVYKDLHLRYRRLSYIQKSIYEISAFLLVGIAFLLFISLKITVGGISFFWLPISYMVIIFALSSHHGGFFTKILSNKVMVRLGQLTFPFYLIHALVISVTSYLFFRMGLQQHTPFHFIVCLTASFLIAFLLHKYIEKPVAKIQTRQRNK